MIALTIATQSFSQYCTAVGPSSTADSNVKSVLLTGEVGQINYTGCPGVIGLQDLTALGTTLNAGASYSAQILFGTCGGNYAGAGQAWIDFDQNGTFDPSESIGTWQGTPPATLSTFGFTVPAGAQNGTTRMRVTQQEAGTLPLNPCAQFTWGSVMDFSITIGNGIDCSGYIGDEITDPIVVSSLPFTGTGDNSYCYSNQNLVYNSPDIYYQITPSPTMESITVSLCGSGFDTFLSVIDPAGNVLAFNDDAPGCGTQSALTFDPQGLGLLYVIVEGWGSNMGEYDISINASFLSTDELSDEKYMIYPNPAKDQITIIGAEGDIQVLDIAGKIVLTLDNYSGEMIDLSQLTDGVYLVNFTVGQQQASQRIIIQR